MGLQRHSAANIHNGQHMVSAGQDLLYILFARTVVMAGIHGGLENLTVIAHLPKGFHRNVMVPAVTLHTHGSIGGITDQLFKLLILLQQLLGDLGLSAAGRSNQHHNARLVGQLRLCSV